MDERLLVVFEAYEKSDFARAFQIALPLAEADLTDAQLFIASIYQLGLGVPVNGQEAVNWYSKAASKGAALAYNNLACIYTVGLPGVKKDNDKSLEYKKKAEELGFNM